MLGNYYPDQLSEDQLYQSYKLIPYGLGSSIVMATIVAALHWYLVPQVIVFVWFALTFIIVLVRSFLQVWFYKTRKRAGINFKKWHRRYILSLFAAGFVWGNAAMFANFHQSDKHQILVAFVLGGLAAGAASASSMFKYSFYFFAVPLLFPLIVYFLISEDGVDRTMGVITILYFVFISFTSRNIFKTTVESLIFKYQNKDLVNELHRSNQFALNKVEELKQEIEARKSMQGELEILSKSLEEKVHQRTQMLNETNSVLQMEVSEKIKAEKALKKNEWKFRSMFETAQEGIWVFNSNCRLRYVNEKMAHMLGYTQLEMINHHRRFFLHHPPQTGGNSLLFKEGIRQITLKKKDGREFWVLESVSFLPGPNEQSKMILGMVTEITERIKKEKKIEELNSQLKEVNKELDAFTYSVSHDLRAPLRTIFGFSEILIEDYGDKFDETGRMYIDHLQKAANRMKSLIDDLLLLSRVSKSDMKRLRVDLSKIAKEIIATLKTEYPNRKVEYQVEDNLIALCDSGLIKIVLENLINNAWKFTSERETAKIEIGSITEEGKNVYFVKDNGAGLDMTFEQKLFKPFQRLHPSTRFSGTGVGLATVKRIITRHRGTIWVQSEIDRGTTFYFTLDG
ncbi:ATP-binding protein [Chitinispirillales bacterium ANBcel5]|uniref:sensor histidine kinase n=1 Tax=Cellulosispirillum alkaliphilum TaxID=3039283 RepID=UPI002A531CDE|nr:ATP-binding protein [Chitinispirillales bacterium ANBcel5]